MHRKLIAATAFVLLSLMLAACGGPDPLDGTSWVLVSYDGTSPLPGTSITLSFADGEMKGSGGCNSYWGSYQVRGERISFGETAITLQACMEPEGVLDQESAYMALLGDVENFVLENDQLILVGSDGKALRFEPE
jgi:heat shock protein HslJ